MATPRFYYSGVLEAQAQITLPPELTHYIQRVLRLATHTQVVLFNGQGGEYTARLQHEGKKTLATIEQHYLIERELPWRISIAQGLATGDKMDWVCEKAVEMGACDLIPIAGQFSTLKLSGERLTKRLAHWQRIAQAASEQCGRNQLLQVHSLHTVAHLTQSEFNQSQLIFCDPEATQDFPAALELATQKNTAHWTLLIGPEGGWSDAEKKAAIQAGAIAMRFGTRVLRTETAAIALLGAIRGHMGWVD